MSNFVETTVGLSKDMPAKIVIYGIPKIGKSRFAAQANDAFFIDLEGGLSYMPTKVRATPKLVIYDEAIGWLKHIYETDSFTAGTIVIDSLDWLETLAQQRLCKQNNARSIVDPACKDFAYHKGVVMAAEDTFNVVKWLDAIYTKKGIKTILVAHSQIKDIDMPDRDPHSRHEMKLSKQLSGKINEWADLILFCDYSFFVSKEGKTSEPKPCLYAGGSASFVGGGRMLLEKEMPIDYKTLEKHITKGK